MSKNIDPLDHTMEKVVAAFRDVGRQLAMVKKDSSVQLYPVCSGRFMLGYQSFSPAGHG